MNDEINLTKTIMDIHEKITSVQKDIQYLSKQMDSKTSKIEALEIRLQKVESEGSRKKAEIFDYVVKAIITVAISFASVRMGLK
jgi:predicted nuclease with TOPRIM domain